MTDSSFDLAVHPWIPCVFADGSVCDCSLTETLERAPEIREVLDPSPLVTVALHRLLLAVLHRGLAEPGGEVWPRTMATWAGVWDERRFPARLGDYLDRMSAEGRFDLCGARAFYQSPRATFAKPPAPISQIVLADRASTNRPAVFDRSSRERLTTAEAARHLVTLHAYAAGGRLHSTEGKSGTQGPLVYGAVFLVRGRDLFETLMSNLVVVTDRTPIGSIDFLPAWERDEEVTVDPAYEPRGYLDLLTHQSRVVRLTHDEEPDADGTLWFPGVNMTSGRTIAGVATSRTSGEPIEGRSKGVAARERTMMLKTENGSTYTLRADRTLWSGAHALYAIDHESARASLGVLDHIWTAEADGLIDLPDGITELTCSGVALKPGGGGVDTWHVERAPLIAPGADDAQRMAARAIVAAAISEAERVDGALHKTSEAFVREVVDTKRAKAVVDASGGGQDYWMTLGAAFLTLVRRAARGEPAAILLDGWARLARGAAEAALERLLVRTASDERRWWNSRSKKYRTAGHARATARRDLADRLDERSRPRTSKETGP